MLRHPDFLYAFDVRGLYFRANLITEISTKVKPKKLPSNYSRQSCVFYSAIHRVPDCIAQVLHLAHQPGSGHRQAHRADQESDHQQDDAVLR